MLLRVRSITYLALRINGYELVDPEECDLPGFMAGAHISVRVGDGPVRDFSLHNDPAERARYCIAVLREPEGQGSREWHEHVRVGEIVERLYREIRALRIYEGATEVQKLIVARELLRDGVRVSQEQNHGAPHA